MNKYEYELFGRVKKNGIYVPDTNLTEVASIKSDHSSYVSFQKNFLSVLFSPDHKIKKVNARTVLSPIDFMPVNSFIEVEFRSRTPKDLVLLYLERQKTFKVYMTSQLYKEEFLLEKKENSKANELLSGFELHTSQKYTFPYCNIEKATEIPLEFCEYFSSDGDKTLFVFSIIFNMIKESISNNMLPSFSTYTMNMNQKRALRFYYGISKSKAICISDSRNLEYEYYLVKPFSDLVYFSLPDKGD
ncbi:MAG: hypothetical protein N3A54_00715 [Patescibacteria group bacterium]|nr:hypothetical protein [Patescibacteria group bacterium]